MVELKSTTGEELAEREGQDCRQWVKVSLVLSFLHALSVGGLAYQEGLQRSLAGELEFVVINYSLWLSPVLVLLIFRRIPAFAVIYAGPILAIFSGRMYFAWQYCERGLNSLKPKGDWASWLMTVFGMISVAIVAFWICIRIAMFVSGDNNRAR